jgi:hypothetical protein
VPGVYRPAVGSLARSIVTRPVSVDAHSSQTSLGRGGGRRQHHAQARPTGAASGGPALHERAEMVGVSLPPVQCQLALRSSAAESNRIQRQSSWGGRGEAVQAAADGSRQWIICACSASSQNSSERIRSASVLHLPLSPPHSDSHSTDGCDPPPPHSSSSPRCRRRIHSTWMC